MCEGCLGGRGLKEVSGGWLWVGGGGGGGYRTDYT